MAEHWFLFDHQTCLYGNEDTQCIVKWNTLIEIIIPKIEVAVGMNNWLGLLTVIARNDTETNHCGNVLIDFYKIRSL